MDNRPIRAEVDYETALKAVSTLLELDPAPGTPQGTEPEILAIRSERYEAEHFSIEEVYGGQKRHSARVRQR
ncbi:hypothetical protein [Burkholderia cenocepacia]|uniref:Uncharacterized protein n=1 Tax=Burkholderia cenocepacia TaxID=95486 RepID=A0A3Q9FCK3_9BURK|nr:hypothetical protein [Burkholderia cenocepacia]AZQ54958.1 hypothetical protein D5R55_29220 [Burkholderia cenocepacia]